MKQIHELFAIPLYEAELDLDLEKMQNYCEEVHKNKNYRNRKVSNQGGFQTELSKSDENIRDLILQIEMHANIFAKNIINNLNQKMDNIWLNVNGYKTSNLSHAHPGADISGTYYVKSPENCGSIAFEHPALDVLAMYQAHQFIDKPNTWEEYNAQTWHFPPKENTIYLFPSWLKHYVNPNENEEGKNRISIAFNLHCSDERN